MGASVQLFETVGWAQELLDDATRADVRHLPRLYTGAAWGCFTGRPDEAVAAAQTRGSARGRPALRRRASPACPASSRRSPRCTPATSTATSRRPSGSPHSRERARGWGLSLLLDGLQASGRVEEALALTDEAMAAARALGNPYFIAYAYWTSGSAHRHTDPDRALALWREGLDYVHQHRVDFFVGFIARDAARLRLVDADPDDALTMFDAAIDAFQQAGNVAQLTITLASATALFERIDRLDSAATLYAAIVRQPGSEHHVPELPELADRLEAQARRRQAFHDHGAAGAAMDLGDTAHFARREIQRALAELRAGGEPRRAPRRAQRPRGRRAAPGGAGPTTREIGERLFISAKTADRHIQNLYTKIGASNRAGATRWAVEHGLVD